MSIVFTSLFPRDIFFPLPYYGILLIRNLYFNTYFEAKISEKRASLGPE